MKDHYQVAKETVAINQPGINTDREEFTRDIYKWLAENTRNIAWDVQVIHFSFCIVASVTVGNETVDWSWRWLQLSEALKWWQTDGWDHFMRGYVRENMTSLTRRLFWQ